MNRLRWEAVSYAARAATIRRTLYSSGFVARHHFPARRRPLRLDLVPEPRKVLRRTTPRRLRPRRQQGTHLATKLAGHTPKTDRRAISRELLRGVI